MLSHNCPDRWSFVTQLLLEASRGRKPRGPQGAASSVSCRGGCHVSPSIYPINTDYVLDIMLGTGCAEMNEPESPSLISTATLILSLHTREMQKREKVHTQHGKRGEDRELEWQKDLSTRPRQVKRSVLSLWKSSLKKCKQPSNLNT